MKIEQMYTGCLAEAAYYIESEGEVAIIDPLRETDPYVQKATAAGAKIKYVFETHFHADFVSGHIDLARKTGAQIVFGPSASAGYECISAAENQEFSVGKIKIRVLHTPGHTLESSCFLLFDEAGTMHCIFTGDTLFIGDVGRPDLAVKSDLTEKDLAGMLYDSLRNKVMTLPDQLIVYPAHGAGSACGKNISKETFDTLGNQKRQNYALQDISREEFIEKLTTGIMPPPQYFPKNAMLNKSGYANIDEVLEGAAKALDVAAFKDAVSKGALILDVRTPAEFQKSHIPGSMFVGLNGQFAIWVGTLVTNLNQAIVLVCPADKEKEAVLRLARVGYDNTIGFLDGGLTSWIEAGNSLDSIDFISPEDFEKIAPSLKSPVLDVRKPGEFSAEHLEMAKSFPLDYFINNLGSLDKNETYYVHCQAGYRSMIACSLMKNAGINKLIDINGGYAALQKTGLPKTDFVCQA